MSWRLYAPVIAVVFLLGWGAIWLHNRDAKNRALGAAQARIERDSALIAAISDSLADARQATSAGIAKVDTVIKGFDRWRTKVVTIPGVRDTVKVPVRFVESADSLRQACGLLMENCDRFKRFADSTMAALRRINADQQVRYEKKPGGRPWGFGAFGGVCTDQKLCGGVGAVLKLF